MTRSNKTHSASNKRSHVSSSHSSSSASYSYGQHSSMGSSHGNPGSYARPNGSGSWYPESSGPSQSGYGQQAGNHANSYRSNDSQASGAGSFGSSNNQPRLQEPGWSPAERQAYSQGHPGLPTSRAQPPQRNHDAVLRDVNVLVSGYGQRPPSTQTYPYATELNDDLDIPSSSRQNSSSSRRDTTSRSSRR